MGVLKRSIAHEFVHLHEPHRGSKLRQRLQRTMPDFADRKRWLAQNSGPYL